MLRPVVSSGYYGVQRCRVRLLTPPPRDRAEAAVWDGVGGWLTSMSDAERTEECRAERQAVEPGSLRRRRPDGQTRRRESTTANWTEQRVWIKGSLAVCVARPAASIGSKQEAATGKKEKEKAEAAEDGKGE